MQSISLINSSSSPILLHPFSPTKRSKNSSFVPMIMASKRGSADQNFGGRLVDESMIILRKRIHEMNLIERSYEAPSNWMEWEKRYYTNYDSMICEAMGVLQTQLMNTRPSVAIASMVLVAITVPTSSALLFLHLFDLVKALLSSS